MLQKDSHLTTKPYVHNAIHDALDESSLLSLDLDGTLKPNKKDSIILISTLTSPRTIIEIPTKAYNDRLHDENEIKRRDLGLSFCVEEVDLVKNNQDIDLKDKKLTDLDSITVKRNPSLNNELSNKKYIDDESDKKVILRFIQTLSKYLKISVGNDTYNLTKSDKIYLIAVTQIRSPNIGRDLLQKMENKNFKQD